MAIKEEYMFWINAARASMKIFFSGIGGSGVSAIAGFMAEKGHFIAGSDRLFDLSFDHPLRKRLEENGVIIFPQNGQGLDGSFDFAVFSTSVEKNNPDFRKAEMLGIPLKTRPEYLSQIVSALQDNSCGRNERQVYYLRHAGLSHAETRDVAEFYRRRPGQTVQDIEEFRKLFC